MEEGEEDMGDMKDSWAKEQDGLADTSSFFCTWAYDQAYSEDGYPDNLHHLSQTDNWSEGVSSNTRLGSLPACCSPSEHHDQYSHHQELGEEGDENICDINAMEEEVNCQKEEGRDYSCKEVRRQLEEGEWAGGGGERGAPPQQEDFSRCTPLDRGAGGPVYHLLSVSDWEGEDEQDE